MTKEQLAVVLARTKDGYENIGKKKSTVCEGDCVILVKGKHRVDVNCLGYDEYTGIK